MISVYRRPDRKRSSSTFGMTIKRTRPASGATLNSILSVAGRPLTLKWRLLNSEPSMTTRRSITAVLLSPASPAAHASRAKMRIMQDSMAHPRVYTGMSLSSWKSGVALTFAVLLALMWFVAGGWKITDPFGMSARMVQAKVPGWLSMPGGMTLGVLEVFAGALLMVPRFRRWGALLSSGMIIFFIGFVGYHYNALAGEE